MKMAKRRGTIKRVVTTMIQASRRVAPSEKAAFHQISGAGRSRVTRQFFGLSPSDEAAIVDRLEADLTRRLKESGR